MREGLPDGVTEIGPVLDCVMEKVCDADFIDSLKTLQKQRDEKKKQRPEDEQQILREYDESVCALIEWYEINRVRWTIANVLD